jgi:hypothetical protein
MKRANKRHPKTGKKQVCIDYGEFYKFADGAVKWKICEGKSLPNTNIANRILNL